MVETKLSPGFVRKIDRCLQILLPFFIINLPNSWGLDNWQHHSVDLAASVWLIGHLQTFNLKTDPFTIAA